VKPKFPEIEPKIEIPFLLEGALIGDFDRYSSGKMVLSQTSVGVSIEGQKQGEMITDIGGMWYVKVGAAIYQLDMKTIFGAVQAVHEKTAKG